MIKVYIKGYHLETVHGDKIKLHANTVYAAKRGKVTEALRKAVRAALNEEVVLETR